jgi:hypothetical protein
VGSGRQEITPVSGRLSLPGSPQLENIDHDNANTKQQCDTTEQQMTQIRVPVFIAVSDTVIGDGARNYDEQIIKQV